MEKQSGISMIILIIIVVIILIIASIGLNYANKLIEEKDLKDLRTDMLLIQAEAKKGLEEFCFQSVNLDKNKEEDNVKIEEIKKANLEGIPVAEVDEQIKNEISQLPEEIVIDENSYYLDEQTLKEMKIERLNTENYGHFIIKYDFENVNIEVINTKGYEGKYTLTQLEEAYNKGEQSN